MTKFALILSAAAALLPVSAPVLAQDPTPSGTAAAAPTVGRMLYSTGGKKLAPVYKLDTAGAPQILLDGRAITIPAATLAEVDGRIETSLTRRELMTRR